jgi:hypothetical protein
MTDVIKPRAAPTGRLSVVSGTPIMDDWGNTTFDQTMVCFANAADRDAQWPSPHPGAMCYLADVGAPMYRSATAWVALAASVPPPIGPTDPLTRYVDATGEVWVAKGGVNGNAYRRARDVLHSRWFRSAALTVGTTATNLAFDSMVADPYGLWTSPQWTIPMAGVYAITVQVILTATAANQGIQAQVAKNGVLTLQTSAASVASGNTWSATNDRLACAAGDVLIPRSQAPVAMPAVVGQLLNTFAQLSYLGTG